MNDYQKVKRIIALSNLVGCIKKFQAQRIELLLLVVHVVIIILCFMNLLIIPWKILNNSLFGLRIVVIVFLFIQLLSLIYNYISRKKKKISYGYYFCLGFFGTLISIGLSMINFLFILISCIVITDKVKSYKQKNYDYKSILVIDIFSLLVIIADFFLWYSEFLLIYAKTDGNLKEYIEERLKFYQSQNKKVVNIYLNDDSNTNKNNKNDRNQLNKIKGKSVDDDFYSNNQMEINEKEINNKMRKKIDDLSSVDTK